jgi:chaperone protein EcpD
MQTRYLPVALALLAGLWVGATQASVVISATRVVFAAQEREVTVQLTNQGVAPALVQAWLDDGDAQAEPEAIQVPFSVSPAMFRLDPDKGQALRLIHTREPMPQDRESLFWLNVLEIPSVASGADAPANSLQIAVRSRIKVLFRPQGLSGLPAQAPAGVQWALRREAGAWQLQARNPSAYFVNLGDISLDLDGQVQALGSGYVAPFDRATFVLANATQTATARVRYIAIDDYGAGRPGDSPVELGHDR